jgi:hypothetical protein
MDAFVTLSILLQGFWPIKGLTSVGYKLFDPPDGTVVSFHFPLPPMVACIFDEFLLNPATAA